MAVLKKAKSGTLTAAVCWFALAVMVSFWGAAVMLAQQDRARTLADADARNKNLAHSLSVHAARTFDFADQIALLVKRQYEQSGQRFDLQRFARDAGINRQIVPGIVITDAQGNTLQFDAPFKRAVNIADREHFKIHAGDDSGKPYISRPLQSRLQDRANIIVSRRLNRPDGSFDGVVGVAVDPEVFTAVYREVTLGDRGLIVMTGLDGFVRARNSGNVDVGGQDVRNGPLFPEYAKRDEGIARYTSVVDGVTRRVAFCRMPGYPIIMSVGVAEETVLAEVNDRARYLFAGALAATLLAIGATAALLYMVRRRERDALRLRDSEARYRRLVEESPDATFVNRGETVLYANAALLYMLGARSVDEVVGKSLFRFLHPDFHDIVRAQMERQDGESISTGVGLRERRYVRFDGRELDVEASSVAVQLPDGPARHVVVRDITSRKRAEAVLRESAERYRSMVEGFPDAVFINRDERIVYANPAALRMLGAADAAQIVGKSPLDLVHPADREAARLRIEQTHDGVDVSGLFEQRFVRIDGSVVETELSVSRVFDQGLPSRQVVARDITERKQIERALRDSESRYRRLVDESPDATLISRRGVILFANPAAFRLLGAQTTEQVIGAPVLRFVHPEHHDDARRRLHAIETGDADPGTSQYERKYVRLDGSEIDVELTGVTVELPDGPARQVIIRDISERKKIEAALRESEERYRMLLDTLPDAVLLYEENRVVYANAAAVAMLGYEFPAQLLGKTMIDLIHPDGHAAALARREFVMKTGQPTGLYEQVFMRRDGSTVPAEGSSIMVPGTSRQRQVVLRDISARKQAEAALRESEARLRMAVESAGMTNWEWDIASDQTHWGYGHEQLLGPLPDGQKRYPDFRNMVHSDDRARFLAAGRATMEVGTPYDVEFRLVRTDGAVRWMRNSGRAIRDDSGRIEGISGVMQDLTRRHDIEQELALSRQRRDALMESIPAPAWLKDREGRFLAVNRAWYRRFRQDPGFAIGRTNSELFPGAAGALRDREDAEVIASGREQRVERHSRVDGEEGWFETVKSPVFDEKGEVSGIVGVSFDITARRRTEEKLRASEERFRQFAESALDVFWIIDLEPQRVAYVNGAAARISGVPVENFYSNPQLWLELIHAEDRERVSTAFGNFVQVPEAEYSEEYRWVRADGDVRWIRDRGTKLRDASGKIYRLQGIAQDITGRRRIELALAESRRRRDALLESNPDPAWLKDLQGRYIAVNRAWFTRRGLAPHDIEGRTDRDYFSADRVPLIEEEDRRVIATKAVLRTERNWKYQDGAAWIETVKAPVLDSAGNVTAIVGLSHDISERKRIEEEVRQMNVSLEQKTAELTALNHELESFAYTVSHDLRAPLRHIDGFVNLLKSHAGPTLDAQSSRYFERVSNAARRMGLLIDDLLGFSRTGRAELRLQRVPLDRVLRDTIEHLRPDTAGRRIDWKIDALPEVNGDAGLLAIVFQNLVANAVKYTRPQDRAKIEIGATDGADGMMTITVRDNGVGFDMRYGNKLFGVFQRLHTDAEFEGTGIGLATVARIVQRHGGRVWAEGALNKGACFYVALPRATPEAKVA